jgi:signal transduction histidine kinase/ligand-binding sensor domain-containing protein/DNA-binding response OmpR family regulator
MPLRRAIYGTRLVFFLCSMLASSIRPAYALDPSKSVKQYVPKLWTVADGLAQPMVQSIAQTGDGYMWFGTQDGLSRFNAEQFKTFDTDNTPGINHNDIRALLTDRRDGSLWIGTYGGGLSHYKDGHFQSFTLEDGLPNLFILALTQLPNSDIWIGTDKGFAVLNGGKIQAFESQDLPITQEIRRISAAPDGSIWLLSKSTIFHIDRLMKVSQADFKISDPSAMDVDDQGNLWIGTENQGVYRWANGTLTHYSDKAGLSKGQIRDIYHDAAGKTWFAVFEAGLCRFQPDSTFDCYGTKDGLPRNRLGTIYEDHEGNLWLGTRPDGLIRLRNTNFVVYDQRSGLSGNYILSLYQGTDGIIWAGGSPGLNRIKDGKITAIQLAHSLTANTVLSIVEKGGGDLWLGTEQGLKLFSGGRVVRTFTMSDGLASNEASALLQDHEGSLWIGDNTGGLTRYKDGKFTRFTQADGISSVRIRNIFEDHEGSVWFSTEDGITWLRNDRFTNFPFQKSDTGAAAGATCAYEDADHSIWIGTYGSGLIRVRHGIFTRFTKKEGLFNDSIWSILEDDNGNLWMSSNRGLSEVRKQDLDDYALGKITSIPSRSYGTADGLPTTDFTGGEQAPGWRTRDGKLLFATSQGLVEIDARHLRRNTVAPPVVIEDVRADGVPISIPGTVPAGQGKLEFHFAALSFVAPEKVVVRYRLEGYDKEWNTPITRGVASYTNMPPDQYRFRVQAANEDGVWNEVDATADVYLTPRFYQRWWFYGSCALSVIIMSFGGIRLHNRRQRRREAELLLLVNERTKELQEEILQRKETEVKLHEQVAERNLATQKAESAARAKGEFLANMSHEIRTPLNGVIGSLELASQTELTAEQKELLHMGRSSAQLLLSVVNGILDFSKIDAGKLHIEAAEFQIADVMDGAARTMAVGAHQKKLELSYFFEPNVPAALLGDANRLKQVLVNLLSNAVKFTPSGEVLLRVQTESRHGSEVQLRFEVSDTGIGIAKDKYATIFEAFSQADTSITRQFGGTGLGLTISARLVDLMGGKLWVKSAEGKGSTFSFTARFTVAEDGKTAALSGVQDALQGSRILLVDDNQTNRSILERILLRWGMRVTSVGSGAHALITLDRAHTARLPFHILLCDARMPEMDGFTLVREMRQNSLSSPAPVMVLTSDDYTESVAQCRQLGIEFHLIKPVKESDLLATMEGVLRPEKNENLASTPDPREYKPSIGGLRVLLAEDNRVNQILAVRMLEKIGHQVVVVDNGRLAVERLRADNAFDLLFMDVHMPEMDGFAATHAIREWERKRGRGKHIPIIAMTASAMAGDREKCLNQGMDAYMAKPFEREDLERVIQYASELSWIKIGM